MLEAGNPYLCVPRQAELSRVTQRVPGSTCCICVPTPGLLPSATRALASNSRPGDGGQHVACLFYCDTGTS